MTDFRQLDSVVQGPQDIVLTHITEATELKFHIKGATFTGGLASHTAQNNLNEFTLPIAMPASALEVKFIHITTEVDGLQQTVLMLAILPKVQTELKPDIMARGFFYSSMEALPSTSMAIAKLSGKELTANSVLEPTELFLTDLEVQEADYALAMTFLHDTPRNLFYTINNFPTLDETALHKREPRQGLVGFDAHFGKQSKRRELIKAFSDGHVRLYDVKGIFRKEVEVAAALVRMVKRENEYAFFDAWGTVYFYDTSLNFLRKKSDLPYADVAAKAEVYLTRNFKVIGRPDLPQSLSYYHLHNKKGGGYVLYAYSETEVHIFEGQERSVRPRVGNVLPYSIGSSTYGAATTDGFNNIDGHQLPDTITNVVSIFKSPTPDTEDSELYIAYRPIEAREHIGSTDYGIILPTIEKEIADTHILNITVLASDPDKLLPIVFPEGFTWKATVEGREGPATYVRSGDEVRIEVTVPEEHKSSFMYALGQSVGQVIILPDDLPKAFRFRPGLGLALDMWYTTNEVIVEDINVYVPVLVGFPEGRFKIIVNGLEVEDVAKAKVKAGDRLKISAQYSESGQLVPVSVGTFETEFGLYEHLEEQMPELRHWAYASPDTYLKSDSITNISQVPIEIHLAEDQDSKFEDGEKIVYLKPGTAAQILYRPKANERATVRYSTVFYDYEWYVWSDNTYLDANPSIDISARNEMKSTIIGPSTVIPEGFWTTVYIPSGLLYTLNGDNPNTTLDARGMNEYPSTQELELAVTTIGLESMPKESGYTLKFGLTPVLWSHDFEPALEYIIEQGEIQTVDLDWTHVKSSVYQEEPQAQKYKPEIVYKERIEVTEKAIQDKVSTVLLSETKASQFDTEHARVPMKDVIHIEGSVAHVTLETFTSKMEHTGYVQTTDWHTREIAQSTVDLDKFLTRMASCSEVEYARVYEHRLSNAGQADLNLDTNHLEESRTLVEPVAPKSVKQEETPKPDWHGSKQIVEEEPGSITSAESIWTRELKVQAFNEPESNHLEYDTYPNELIPTEYDEVEPSKVTRYGIDHKQHILQHISHRGINHTVELVASNRGLYQWYTENEATVTKMLYKDATLSRGYEHGDFGLQLFVSPSSGQTDSEALLGMENQHAQDMPWAQKEPLTESVEPSYVFGSGILSDYKVASDVFSGKLNQKQSINTAYSIENFGYGSPVVNLILSTDDPLLDGYFETELLALQNAVEIWGFDPSMVYAILQPNGYYTWAQVTVCLDLCHGVSCSTRGYISGG